MACGELLALLVLLLFLCVWFFSSGTPPRESVFARGYFDSNSTTSTRSEAKQKMQEGLELGNASSPGSEEARRRVREAEEILLQTAGPGWKGGSVVHTSGASESNALFLRGVVDSYWNQAGDQAPVPHLVSSTVEHKSVLLCLRELSRLGRIELTLLPPDSSGRVDPLSVAFSLRPNTLAVSLLHVHNELGGVNPISEISRAIALYNSSERREKPPVFFHTDAAQSFGKIPVPGVDACSLSAHKFHGPPGVGALILSPRLERWLAAGGAQITGTQNRGLRGGTLNLPGILGEAEAARLSLQERGETLAHTLRLKTRLVQSLSKRFPVRTLENFLSSPLPLKTPGVIVFLGPVGENLLPDPWLTLPTTLSFSFVKLSPGRSFCNLKIQRELSELGFQVSTGSACNSEPPSPHQGDHLSRDYVLREIGAPPLLRCGMLRVSFSRENTFQELEELTRALVDRVEAQFLC